MNQVDEVLKTLEFRWFIVTNRELFLQTSDSQTLRHSKLKLRWGRATFGAWVAHGIMGCNCYENISIQRCGSQQSRACSPCWQLYACCFCCSALNDVLCVCLHICVLLCSFSISRFDWECLFYIPFFVWLVESTQVASALLAAIFACELQAGDTGKTPLMQTRVSGQVCASFCEEAKKLRQSWHRSTRVITPVAPLHHALLGRECGLGWIWVTFQHIYGWLSYCENEWFLLCA